MLKKEDDIERYIYMRSLFDRNVTLAHAVIATDIPRFMEIIYTPTVGLACQQYSSMFRSANGVHIYPGNIDIAEDILRRYGHRDIRGYRQPGDPGNRRPGRRGYSDLSRKADAVYPGCRHSALALSADIP